MICLCCGAEAHTGGGTCVRCGEASWGPGPALEKAKTTSKPRPVKKTAKKTAAKSKPGRKLPRRSGED
jgi:hypothetical protein